MVKHLPAIQETRVPSLSWEDLEKEMATHSSIMYYVDFLGGSVGKNRLAMQETQVRYLGWKDPLEECMATHSSIFAWKILWREEPGRLQFIRPHRHRHD